MAKPIRQWKAFCPNCDYPSIFPEFKNDTICFTIVCSHCGTEYICPSYRFECEFCLNTEHCMERPSAESLIYSSTWRGMIHARSLGFKKLASRDLQCLYYLREEDRAAQEDIELPIFARLQNKPETVTIETDTRKFIFGVPQPKSKPDFCPVVPRLGMLARRSHD